MSLGWAATQYEQYLYKKINLDTTYTRSGKIQGRRWERQSATGQGARPQNEPAFLAAWSQMSSLQNYEQTHSSWLGPLLCGTLHGSPRKTVQCPSSPARPVSRGRVLGATKGFPSFLPLERFLTSAWQIRMKTGREREREPSWALGTEQGHHSYLHVPHYSIITFYKPNLQDLINFILSWGICSVTTHLCQPLGEHWLT